MVATHSTTHTFQQSAWLAVPKLADIQSTSGTVGCCYEVKHDRGHADSDGAQTTSGQTKSLAAHP